MEGHTLAHPLDVVEKCAPDAIIGVVGSGKAKGPGSCEVGLACIEFTTVQDTLSITE